MEKTSATRIRDRKNWPVRVFRLGEEPSDDLSGSTTAEERLAMMWELAERGWLIAGFDFPNYARNETPGRVFQREP